MSSIKPVVGSGSGGGTATVPDGSITNVKVANGAAISADKLVDGAANKVLTAAERTWLSGGRGVNIPALAGETGVVDTSYPVGHGHRYGISTDPNAALAAMRDLVTSTNAALSRVDPSGTDRIPLYSLYIPAGRYVVTTPGAFLSGTSPDGRRVRGVIIRGAGRGATTDIVFDPTSSGYLFDNQERMSRITFEDITFTGASTNANFMNSVSNGGPQAMVCDRVQWRGTWTNGFYLSGTDTNSEFTWNDCTVYGFWSYFLLNDNPQGLNYNFFGCHVEPESGWMISMNTGGSIDVIGGSWMGNRSSGGESGGFFQFHPTGSSAPGETRLLMQGTRTEHRSASWKLIDCSWPNGVITFKNINDVGNTSMDTTATRATFSSSYSMPVVTFEDCRLGGKHEYIQTGSNDQAPPRLISYRNCIIEHYGNAEDFIIQTLSSGAVGRNAALPPIRFDRCRSNLAAYAGSWNIMDQTLNGRSAQAAVLRKQTVSFKDWAAGTGQLPGASLGTTLTLPLGAVITSIRLFAPAGASAGSSTAWSYTVKSGTTGTVTTLLTYGGAQTAAGMSAGYNTEVIPMFVCTTTDSRDITLTAGASNSASGAAALCLVEYLS